MPNRQRLNFTNRQGIELAAALETPDREPRAFVLFAHCFTCGKDSAAASRIARTLVGNGFAVLRFDFTGLGGSEGDFANSNFSSNVADLIDAADMLREQHQAPQVLVGHSLGGAAVVAAASSIAEARAVVTIGAPASAEHVIKQFAASVETIERDGAAQVTLGSREFTIQSQFLEDLRASSLNASLRTLKRALLVMHAPLDATVSINEASHLFSTAKHPKSFVSLDSADHLLTKLADAQYVADTLAAWATRYIEEPAIERRAVDGGEVHVGEANQKFLREVSSDDHHWLADEPKKVGGENLGPDPYEHLLAALGTCTSMTIRMYANRKKWPLESVDVTLSHRREHQQDCENCEDAGSKVDILHRSISFTGELDAEQRARLLEIADRCPVHRTLEGELLITTEAADSA